MSPKKNNERVRILLLELQKRKCEDSYFEFFKHAWAILEPKTPLKLNWHLKYICDQLEEEIHRVGRALPKTHDLIINIPPRLIADDTQVLTSRGWTTHGALMVGDEVFSISGKPTRVIEVHPKAMADHRVTFTNGEVIDCNGDHLWTVFDRTRHKWATLKTSDMLDGRFDGISRWGTMRQSWAKANLWDGRARFQLPKTEALEFPEQALPLDPYFVGAWLGDGTSNKPVITRSVKEHEIIAKIESRGLKVSAEHFHPNGSTACANFCHQNVMKHIRELGMFRNKHIPDIYKFSSIEQRLQLVAGLVDTDGYCDKFGRVTVTGVNKLLMSDLFDIATSLGWTPVTCEVAPGTFGSRSKAGGKPVQAVQFYPNQYIPVALERKQPKRNRVERRIGFRSIELIDPRRGNCITVDADDGLYLVGKRCVPTHNSAKSHLVSVMLCPWAWIRYPHLRFINASHSGRLSIKHCVMSRMLILSEWYQRFWSDRFSLVDDQNQKTNFRNNHLGERIATSVGASITGEGADCLVAGTMVKTEHGDIDIERLIRLRCKVWAYNHETGTAELCRIQHSRRIESSEIYEVITQKGRRIRCTGDHRFYVKGSGYREASILAKGDKFVCLERIQSLPNLWRIQKERIWILVPEMLFRSALHKMCDGVRLLQKGISETSLRIQQSIKEWLSNCLLLSRLSFEASIRTNPEEVLDLQAPCGKENTKVLRQRLSSTSIKDPEKKLPNLCKRVSSFLLKASVLFPKMCRFTSFKKDDREGELALQDRKELRPLVSSDETTNQRKRWRLRGLQKNNLHRNSSHRSYSSEQQSRQSSCPLQGSSYSPPSLEEDIVAVVRRVRSAGEPVYDIQVEGCHNFFANEILVHNCITADDLLDPLQAASDADRARANDYWDQSLYNRLNDPEVGLRIIVMQRLHDDDTTGHALKVDKKDTDNPDAIDRPKEFKHVSIPAEDKGFISPPELIEKYKDGLFFPDRFTRQFLDKAPRILTSLGYACQYLQKVMPPEGNIVKRSWFNFTDKMPDDSFFETMTQSWDLAFKDGYTSDYVVGQVWGLLKGKHYLVRQVRDRMDITKTIEMILKFTLWHPRAVKKLIEDKANGPAVISLLKSKINGLIPVEVKDSKEARYIAASPIIESGAVWVLNPVTNLWVEDFLQEVTKFPNADHDDQGDAMVQYLLNAERDTLEGLRNFLKMGGM